MACVGTYVCPQISENQSDEEERFKENIVRLHNVIRSVRLPLFVLVEKHFWTVLFTMDIVLESNRSIKFIVSDAVIKIN